MLEVLVVKIKKQMAGWKSVLLPNGENLILIKYVLLSMPIHSFSVLRPLRQFASGFCDFFLSFSGERLMGRLKYVGGMG